MTAGGNGARVKIEDLVGAVYVAGGQLRLTNGRVVWIGDVIDLIGEAVALLQWHRTRQSQEPADP